MKMNSKKETKKKIAIETDDALLERELSLLLSQNGHKSVIYKSDGTQHPDKEYDLMITDSEKTYSEAGTMAAMLVHPPFLHSEFLHELEEAMNYDHGNAVTLDSYSLTARVGNRAVKLTKNEAAILSALLSKRGSAVTYAELSRVIGADADCSNEAAVYIRHLREKLEEGTDSHLIFTVRGKGYMLK